MDILDRFMRARVRLMIIEPWIGQIACYLQFRESDKIPTVAINAEGIVYYNKKFIDSVSDNDLLFIFYHEILHLVFQHFWRIQGRNPYVWNLAADLKINYCLSYVPDLRVPESAVTVFNFENKIDDVESKTTEQIYDELIKTFPMIQNIEVSIGADGTIKIKGLQEKQASKLTNQIKEILERSIYDIVEGIKEMKEGKVDSNKCLKDWIGRVEAAKSIKKGNFSTGMEREFKALDYPEIPWSRVLRQRFLKTQLTRNWKRISKRYLPDYFPGLVKRKNLKAICAIDTSGSMTDEDLTKAISEIYSLAGSFKTFNFGIVFNDLKVWDYVEVTDKNKSRIRNLKPKGGGGTDFRPVFELIKEKFKDKIDSLIFFTDGYGDFPKTKPSYSTYWVTRSSDVEWPFGTVLRLSN